MSQLVVSGKAPIYVVPAGVYDAACVEIIDLGMVEDKVYNKISHKIRVVFELDHKVPDKDMNARISKKFNLSIAKYKGGMQTSLRKFLTDWRGKDFTLEEEKGFDLSVLLGRRCTLVVSNTEKDGSVMFEISSVVKAGKGNTFEFGETKIWTEEERKAEYERGRAEKEKNVVNPPKSNSTPSNNKSGKSSFVPPANSKKQDVIPEEENDLPF